MVLALIMGGVTKYIMNTYLGMYMRTLIRVGGCLIIRLRVMWSSFFLHTFNTYILTNVVILHNRTGVLITILHTSGHITTGASQL